MRLMSQRRLSVSSLGALWLVLVACAVAALLLGSQSVQDVAFIVLFVLVSAVVLSAVSRTGLPFVGRGLGGAGADGKLSGDLREPPPEYIKSAVEPSEDAWARERARYRATQAERRRSRDPDGSA